MYRAPDRRPSAAEFNFLFKTKQNHWENEGRVHEARIFTASSCSYGSLVPNQCKFSIDLTCFLYAFLRWF